MGALFFLFAVEPLTRAPPAALSDWRITALVMVAAALCGFYSAREQKNAEEVSK